MLALGYVAGRIHGWSELRETEAQLHVAVEEHERAIASARRRHGAQLERQVAATEEQRAHVRRERELNMLYGGLNDLYSALLALDARNSSLAETRVRDAEEQLTQARNVIQGLDRVVALVAATNIVAARDLAKQRAAVVSLLTEVDQLILHQRSHRGLLGASDTNTADHRAQLMSWGSR